VPAEVLAGFAPSRVAVGRTHACAVVSGQVRCWGANDQGQLGQATPASSSATPLDPVPEVADAFDVAVGDANSCAITSAGAVFCWGANPALGTGTGVVQVQGLVATEIASGTAHVCATTTTGITCWGADDHGQVGIVSSLPVPPTPVSFRGGALTPNVIATGESHSCTLVNNEVNCWGADAFGQLGNGGTTDTPVPQRVPLLNPTPVLAGGGGHTCAYYLGGTPVGGEDDPPTQQGLYCWGNNDQGQLGGSSTLLAVTTPTTPVPFASPEPVASLAAGSSHTCALMQSKALLCWGSNDQGQVGTGSTGGDVPTPTQVTSK
jgi:alpha-tubulin suppressor-like RCC1 family protein